MSTRRVFGLALALSFLPAFAPAQTGRADVAALFSALEFRSIGPAVVGGRIHGVEALPDDPATIYVATASGGIWKTVNKGTDWTPVFDDQPVSTFGDIAIAPSNPEILYAGTGEQNNRQSTSWGNGVYRSDDGGETWRHLGLDETRHIGKVEVHPTNPDIAYVAALGNLWRGSPERGVFKTTDGGRTWEKVLYVDEYTGAVDMVMDPSDPGTLYAATYQRLRRSWGFNGGGPGSGIYKTTDGGDNWDELTDGIPSGDKGRIGLAIARTNPQVLNAIIQHAEEGGVYRSEDGGRSWTQVSDQNIRPMYYSHIYIDPTNENRVYRLATYSFRSEDGGRTWTDISARLTYDVGVHSDHHDMWIDPNHPDHFYLVGDAGFYETWDRGSRYTRINNFPIAQFYGIGVDMRDPYWIYGGLQDNHSFMGPSATRHWAGIINDDWRQIGFGDGMYWQVDPNSPRYAFGNAQNGSWTRVDAFTGDLMDIEPLEPEGEDFRYDWVSPSLLSRHDIPPTFYAGGNYLFISEDLGSSWRRTEDLSRQIDRDTLELMGVKGADITLSRNDGTSSFGEATTIGESPLDPAILWVGMDDGNLQVSRDAGESWTEVSGNVRGVPDGTYVSRITPSAAAPGVAYATFDAHRDGDFRPYVFKTEDFGRSWMQITDGLQGAGSVNEIIEHPDDPDVLFLGTEHALYVSLDAGSHWHRFGANLPTTAYDDMLIHPRDKDLVVATHGRAIWILDDAGFLTDWSRDAARARAHLFPVRRATIFQYWKDTSYRGQDLYAGTNPPFGAIIRYHLGREADARIEIRRDDGWLIRTLDVPEEAGVIHTVTWDLRHEPPASFDFFGRDEEEEQPELPHPVEPRGPFVSPGTYTVALVTDGREVTRTVEVRGDPEMPITDEQYRRREAFLVELAALQNRVADAFEEVETLRRASEEPTAAMNQLRGRLNGIRRGLSGLASTFNGRGVRQGTLYPPTETHQAEKQRLAHELQEALQTLARLR